MLTLFPPITAYAVHQLSVDSPHVLYVEECGNPKGLPILFIHGGPGAASDQDSRRFFDPEFYRIVLFDQRGSGQSTPHAELKGNTTQALIQDMEAIREYLKIDRWILFGGSWGSTLALVYAETYPERVMNMILRGIFLCRQEDLAWLYEAGGASRLFPDYWDEFVGHLPREEQNHVMKNYFHRLCGEDEVAKMAAAKAWSQWAGSCATLQPNTQVVNRFMNPHMAISLSRIATHYYLNKAFLEPNQILKNVHRIANISGVLVHGRYDVICPVDNAYALQKKWPKSELQIIRDAGHSSAEPGIINALVLATTTLAQHYKV